MHLEVTSCVSLMSAGNSAVIALGAIVESSALLLQPESLEFCFA